MVTRTDCSGNSELLFFIIVFLLLFYDGSAIGLASRRPVCNTSHGDSSILFFIIIFLLLFY